MMNQIATGIAVSVGSGIILATLGWLWIVATRDGQAFWAALGSVTYEEAGVTRVFEIRGVKAVLLVAVFGVALALAAFVASILRTSNAAFVQGMVIASDVSCESLGEGWKEFHEARSRFLVGADPSTDSGVGTFDGLSRPLSKHRIRDHAGFEQVRLSPAQIPAVEVQVFTSDHSEPSRIGSQLESRNDANKEGVLSEARSGGDKPFISWKTKDGTDEVPTMPPFYAVYFCKKS